MKEVEALVISDVSVRRERVLVVASTPLEQALNVAERVEGPWDLVVTGDLLPQLEIAASKSVSGSRGRLWRIGVAVFGGVRGNGISALVQEIGLAANRAAGFRTDARTVFVFKDWSLVQALANNGHGPRLGERREREGLSAVLANPGAF
jgi:hypothetical protein